MGSKNPFSQENLNDIFKLSATKPDRIVSRESSGLEFKESFGWGSLAKYLKTCAAYANTHGGYVVFGIANKPHDMIGLSGKNLRNFENVDPERISNHFNNHFAPEIEWDIQEYELKSKTFGLIYVHEARDKPVVCKKDAGTDLREGDIYYRYRGRSERIKYAELRTILEEKRRREQRLWMQHLTKIARIGVRDAGVFDLQSGQVTGTEGTFVIDESLLSQLSFIKEGEFSESRGNPTLKLVGNVEVIGSTLAGYGRKQVVKTRGIRVGDIVEAFLGHVSVSEPREFISQICFESTGFLPVYYFMDSAGLDVDQTVAMLNKIVARSTAKTKLIQRLRDQTTQYVPIPGSDNLSAQKKRNFAEQLLNGSVDETIVKDDLKYCLQAIRGLSVNDIRRQSKSLRALLQTLFHRHYASAEVGLADNLRRATCWVDEALYMETVK